MNFKSLQRIVTILLALIVLTGCSVKIPVAPELQFVNPPDRIKNDYIGAKVTLINENKDNEFKYFGDYSIHTLEGNMHEWTKQVIELATKEIAQRGGAVTADADRDIYMSFEGDGFVAMTVAGGWICKGTLKVETSSGYKRQYHLSNRTGGSMNRACGGAITLGVIEFLNDEHIVEFMTSTNP